MRRFRLLATWLVASIPLPLAAQSAAIPSIDIAVIIDSVQAKRIESDVMTLVGFGTRNTFSDTLSETRGIGAARRWIKAEFERISEACGGCLDVYYQRSLVTAEGSSRIPEDVWVVNVVAVQRGTVHPGRHVIMTGDIDSRASDGTDATTDAPGANDNASGMAGTLEAARVLSKYSFGKSIVYAGLSGEEQGLLGGKHMAEQALADGWIIEAVLNNDMIGNISGIDGVIENNTFRVFSEPVPATWGDREWRRLRYYGGEVDGPSRQLARYIARVADLHFPNLEAKMIYRLDRFGRGGHHRPFNDAGFPAVRIMETHENYNRQHQDVREEGEVRYGDTIDGVDFDYAASLTAVNAATLASLAWAPPNPADVGMGGAVQPSTFLEWSPVEDPDLSGYRIYWRETTAPQWENSVFVGERSDFVLKGLVIDNYLFGVSAVSTRGYESTVSYPLREIR
jgi:Zn-dependent M28 family amino/carboxypeptidase